MAAEQFRIESVSLATAATLIALCGLLGIIAWTAFYPATCTFDWTVAGSPSFGIDGNFQASAPAGTNYGQGIGTSEGPTNLSITHIGASVGNAQVHLHGQVFCRDVPAIAAAIGENKRGY